ncbi:MAG: hypothetical protein EOP33_03135 [Rickettsiaceae bacterium]|nr:MAG: hypothetical protein EOP33_03135 [Rickettsiaceae bacterium]
MNKIKLALLSIVLLMSFESIACGHCGHIVSIDEFFPLPSYIGSEPESGFVVMIPSVSTTMMDYCSDEKVLNAYSKGFVEGHIPVLPVRSDLNSFLLTYRYLEGKPNINAKFTFDEQEAKEDYFEIWQKLSKEFDQLNIVEISRYKEFQEADSHYNTENCSIDAFKFAVQQFHIKREKYETNNFKTWFDNQNTVFKNCNSTALVLPQLSNNNDVNLLKDYNYQLACSYFYNGDYNQAIDMFETISNDSDSPYQQLADYLIFRSLFREARHRNDQVKIRQLSDIFDQKLEDKKSNIKKSDYMQDILKLKSYFVAKISPQKRVDQLLDNLINKDFNKQDILDLKYLSSSKNGRSGFNINSTNHPFKSWSDIFRYGTIVEALELWDKYKTTPWLMLVSEKVTKENLPVKIEILAALNKIKKEEPGYVMAQQYLAKFALLANDDTCLKNITNNMLNSENLVLYEQIMFKYLRSYTAENYKDFINDITVPFNKLSFLKVQQVPIEFFTEASTYELPPYLSKQFLAASFTRHVILGNISEVKKMIPALIRTIPELESDFQSFDDKDDNEKLAFAHLIIMRYPSFSIYVDGDKRDVDMELDHDKGYKAGIKPYGPNWWIALAIYEQNLVTNFLSEKQKQSASLELNLIDKTIGKNITNYFCNKAISAYQTKFDFAPQMLHLCVYMSRYKSDEAAPLSSKKAFYLLHKNFKDNFFTKKTPYHFYVTPN